MGGNVGTTLSVVRRTAFSPAGTEREREVMDVEGLSEADLLNI